MYTIPFWISLFVIIPGRITCAVIINSFNGLTVGSNELNGIGNDNTDMINVNNVSGASRSYPRSNYGRSAPVSYSSSASSSASSVSINSFQGNIGGSNSFQNNAGISLIPTRNAAATYRSSWSATTDPWKVFRRRMQIWAAQLRARYRLYYSLYPYAYIYWNY
ncbi:Uncharacterized protein BM_BM578 [Brugia malayi]|uniref:Uncharacterized protein n=2 Tax=Brugia malayi TaxID=6279 RepID=A0A4E9FLJ9_BRUMA|nr:Uncharacterized protein BM_BM578 [Brugia malayi]VIO97851.1 Uncharacterized protein BM_BM578 [Brugia malayi]